MAMTEQWKPRVAGVDDSDDVARLLHDFNTEFDAPSPGPVTLVTRLRALLAGDDTFAVLVGEPAVGVGLVTTRPNVWYEGAVALLDELYVAPEARGQGAGSALIDLVVETCRQLGVDLVEINVDEDDVDAQRFYRRHGFTSTEPDSEERAFYFHMELI
jgi:ribosomal protein S18 acetylase RimI-like enzyme